MYTDDIIILCFLLIGLFYAIKWLRIKILVHNARKNIKRKNKKKNLYRTRMVKNSMFEQPSHQEYIETCWNEIKNL